MSSQATDAGEVWYKRWYVPGVITLLVGLVVLSFQLAARALGIDLPYVAYLSVLTAGMVFSLGWLLEKNWTRIQDQVRGDVLTIRDDVSGIRDDIIALSAVREPYLAYLRERLFRRARRPLVQLTNKEYSIPTVEDCTDQLIEHLGKIDVSTTREILAVCGQKAWNSPDVRKYYQKNYELSCRGVKVKRIFLAEPGKEFSEGEKRVLREHLSDEYPHVEGRVIFPEDLSELESYKFPSGFGFAILGEAVIVHWGLGASRREAGRILADPWWAEVHTKIFQRMWSIASGDPAEIHRRILGSAPGPGRGDREAQPGPAPSGR